MSKRVLAVIGGQYGSEGKGVVVAALARDYDIHVRVGGPNAGHSFVHQGRVYKMQSVPCGWTNPNAVLVIGRGALISLEQLSTEMDEIAATDPTIWDRVKVDAGAHVIDPEWHNEGHTGGELHQRIGSTGEGIGAARVARTNRDPDRIYNFEQAMNTFEKYAKLRALATKDTAYWLNRQAQGGTSILLEGTQGAGLSLIHGPWPYTTSTDVSVAQMCADTGLATSRVGRRMLVCRTFPIRVAGNSGPLEGEITWDEMSERLGKPVQERTTVTRLVRRIGRWDEVLVRQSILRNDPTSLALTFMDYLNPIDEGVTEYGLLSDQSRKFATYVVSAFGVPISYLGTGGEGWKTIRMGTP